MTRNTRRYFAWRERWQDFRADDYLSALEDLTHRLTVHGKV